MRSVLERFLALFLLVVLSPILSVISIGVWLSSPGPIIFRQERVGYRGRLFIVYKFRGMYDKPWPVESITKNDPRVTGFGRFIRRTHLDELPQLWNIVRGEMVFVGPRPQPVKIVQEYESRYPRYRHRTSLQPGITGLAQVTYKKGYPRNMRQRVAFDELYRMRRSICLDTVIALKTIQKMCQGTSY